MIDLQAAFEVHDSQCLDDLHSYALDRGLIPVVISGIKRFVLYATPNLCTDDRLANLFTTVNVNTSSILSTEALIILNEVADEQFTSKVEQSCLKLEKDHVISLYAMQTDRNLLTVVTKSVLEIRPIVLRFQQIDGLKDIPTFTPAGYSGILALNCICLRQNIEAKVAECCLLISDILASVDFQDKAELVVASMTSEMDQSVLIAMLFVFECLIDAAHTSPPLQRVFTDQGFRCLIWLNWHARNYINNVDRDWTAFWMIKVLEMMIPVMALKNYERHIDWRGSFESFKSSIGEMLRLSLNEGESQVVAYIVDQANTFIAKYERIKPRMSPAERTSSRFPDHVFLSSLGFFVFSLMKTTSQSSLMYKCLNKITRKLVVIKRIPKDYLKSIKKNEIDILKGLKHPNILSYQDCFETTDYIFLVMSFCEDKLLIKKKSEQFVRRIGRQILNGLVYLHSNHLVHKDLRPSKILEDGCGFIKIAGFGEARLIDVNKRPKDIDLVNLLGTPAYMAPECLYHANVEPSSDIWSFGCIMGLLLSGLQPWSLCDSKLNLVFKLGSSDQTPFILNDLQVSTEFKNILVDCFNRDPSLRPRSITLLNHPIFSDIPDSIV